MAAESKGSSKAPWSNEELRRSVEVYVLLLRLQLQGSYSRTEPVAQALLSGPLALRNDAAIRYRMRNISAVVRELGVQTLKDFSPAESVGSQVRARIKDLLLDNSDFARLYRPPARLPDEERRDALSALRGLREYIMELERDLSRFGHNHPPEQQSLEIDREQFRQALHDIEAIEFELEKTTPDKAKADESRSRLVQMASDLAKWLSDRTTKFVDAALVAAAPLVVAKMTGLLPVLVNAAEAVARALAQ